MSKIFRQPKWKNAMCVLWIITVLGVLPACDSLRIHDSVTSKCDKDKLDNAHVCRISEAFNHPSTRCSFTFTVECEGSMYAGHGSLCKSGLSLASTFECKSGFWTSKGNQIIRPPSIKNCPKSLNTVADDGKTTASVSWNKPTVEEGIELRMVKGKAPNSTFNEGKTKIIYQALDPKTSATATCIFYVTVTVHYCSPSVTYHAHRNYHCTSERPVQGSSCKFACENGYNLIGKSEVKCNRPQGTWSSVFPVCTARSCEEPGKVEGGTYSCPDGWMYPNMCFITCNQGYQNLGVQFIKCKPDGVWSQSSPCIDVESPKFPNGCPVDMELFSGPLESPVQVTWDTPEVTDNSDLNVNLRSNPQNGSLINPGTHIIKITATDDKQNTASCSFVVTIKVRSCPPLSIPSNGRVTCANGYVEGSVCTVRCSQGYTLEGNASLTCTASKQWSVDMPVCEVIMCPSQPIVNHGVITCGSGRQYLSACTLSCHPGFKAVTPFFIECLSNGSWTVPGECIDVEPPTFVNGCPDNLEVSASRLGLNTTAIWSQPIVTDNSGGIITVTSSIHNGSVFSPGVTFVTYTAVDTSGNSRSCHFSVTVTTLMCATPDLELPNRTRTLMMYDCPNGYVYGATCSLSCSHGFPLVGVKYIICEIHENTAPPSMYWNWTASSAAKPECRVTNCSTLAPPQNGALSCFLGNFGWNCLMSCNSAWAVPMASDGHFYCIDSIGFWIPSRVPDCVGWKLLT